MFKFFNLYFLSIVPSDSIIKNLSSKTIDQFKITGVIKRGGMADVYEAYDKQNKRKAALKILNEKFVDDNDLVIRFNSESKILEYLQSKYEEAPFVKVYKHSGDSYSNKKSPFIAMELLRGTSLDDLLRQRTFTYQEALIIIRETAKTAYYAHQDKIWQKDVSPENIIILFSGKAITGVRVINYGRAINEYSGQDTDSPSINDKLPFMSPEQCRNEKIDGRSDIYSLGIVFYTILKGNQPFESTNPSEIIEMHNSAPVPQLSVSIPDDIKFIIDKMLQKDKEERYQTISEVLEEIEKIISRYEIKDSIKKITAHKSSAKKLSRSFKLPEGIIPDAFFSTGVISLVVIIMAVIFSIMYSGRKDKPDKDLVSKIEKYNNSDSQTEKNVNNPAEAANKKINSVENTAKTENKNITDNEPIKSKKEKNDEKQPAAEEQPPALYIESQNIKFNNTEVFDTKEQNIIVSNQGKKKLIISSISFVSNDEHSFELNKLSIPLEIEKNSSRSISVRFSPLSPGAKKASLDIVSNDKNQRIELAGNAIGKQKVNIADIFQKGMSELSNEDYEQSEKQFSIVIKENPAHPGALYNRGISRYKQGEYRNAINDFDNAYKYTQLIPSNNRALHRCNCQYYIAVCTYSLWNIAKDPQQKEVLRKDAVNKLENFLDNRNLDKDFMSNARKYLTVLNKN